MTQVTTDFYIFGDPNTVSEPSEFIVGSLDYYVNGQIQPIRDFQVSGRGEVSISGGSLPAIFDYDIFKFDIDSSDSNKFLQVYTHNRSSNFFPISLYRDSNLDGELQSPGDELLVSNFDGASFKIALGELGEGPFFLRVGGAVSSTYDLDVVVVEQYSLSPGEEVNISDKINRNGAFTKGGIANTYSFSNLSPFDEGNIVIRVDTSASGDPMPFLRVIRDSLPFSPFSITGNDIFDSDDEILSVTSDGYASFEAKGASRFFVSLFRSATGPDPQPSSNNPAYDLSVAFEQIDLEGTFFDVTQESLKKGDTFTIDLDIKNNGSSDIGVIPISFYISKDSVITISDNKLLDFALLDRLEGNSTISPTVNVTLPDPEDSFWSDNIENYYIGMIIGSFLNEYDESNNSNNGESLDYERVVIKNPVSSPIFDGMLDNSLDFDPLQYVASYGDLINAFGLNLEAASQHYRQSGQVEERTADGFDEVRYLASNGDLISAFGPNFEAATVHYVSSGAAENRSTNAFDPISYLNNYADLQAAYGNDLFGATLHYIQSGFFEGRDPRGPSSNFSGRLDDALGFAPLQYLASHQDLITSFGLNPAAASQHYRQSGQVEERTADGFDEVRYLASNGDLISAFGPNFEAATVHYVSSGAAENRSTNAFDPISYLNNYADLQAAYGNDLFGATLHYIQSGFFEGRVF